MAEYQSELKLKRIISVLLFISYCMKENNIIIDKKNKIKIEETKDNDINH